MLTNVTELSPKEIIGGIGKELSITGHGFGSQRGSNFVSFNQDDSNTYLDSSEANKLNYVGWSDNEIIVEMPYAYSGNIHVNVNGIDYYSNGILKLKANLDNRDCNKEKYFLINQNGKGGHTWYMDSSYFYNPSKRKAIEDVFRELRRVTGVNFILADCSSNEEPSCSSSINLIAPDSKISSGGKTYFNWGFCANDRNRINYPNSWNIGMCNKEVWYDGFGKAPQGQAKFRYVLMHELGHTVGLSDVSNNEYGQTMNSCVSNYWNVNDNFSDDEIIAMSYFVQKSQELIFNDCGKSQLLPITDYNDIY